MSPSRVRATALRHEAFCLGLLRGLSAADAARGAGYGRKDVNVRTIAWELLQRSDIRERLAELMTQATNSAVMGVIERKVRLSEWARAKYDDPERGACPIDAISLLNKMEGLYPAKSRVDGTVAHIEADIDGVREHIAEKVRKAA